MEDQFSVKHFLDKVPDKDALGIPIPQWKREKMAQKAVEDAKREHAERLKKLEEEREREEEARKREQEELMLQSLPAWKRELARRKLAENAAEEAKRKLQEQMEREAEERRRMEEERRREEEEKLLQSLPIWKRHLMEKQTS